MSNWVCVQAWPLFSFCRWFEGNPRQLFSCQSTTRKVSYQRITPCNIHIFIISHSCKNILFKWGVLGSFHFEHQCKGSSLDIVSCIAQSYLSTCRTICFMSIHCFFFLEETQTTWIWGKVISRWIFCYSWIPGNNQFALEVLGLAALLENSDVLYIETFIDNQVSEIVLLSPQFFQFGLSLNGFPVFFKILNFLFNPL